MLRYLLLFLFLLCTSAHSVFASPLVYASSDGSAPSTPAEIPIAELSFELDIWFDAGEEFYDFSLSLAATPGLGLTSFDPDPLLNPTVSFMSGDAGELILIDSSSVSPWTGPVRVGSLFVDGTGVGASLDLVDLPTSIAPSFTNAAFELILIPVPQTVAVVVPEPGTALLVSLGMIALSIRRRPLL